MVIIAYFNPKIQSKNRIYCALNPLGLNFYFVILTPPFITVFAGFSSAPPAPQGASCPVANSVVLPGCSTAGDVRGEALRARDN